MEVHSVGSVKRDCCPSREDEATQAALDLRLGLVRPEKENSTVLTYYRRKDIRHDRSVLPKCDFDVL